MTNGNRKIKSAAHKLSKSTGLKYTEARRVAECTVPESAEALTLVNKLVEGYDLDFKIKTSTGIVESVLIVSSQLGYYDSDLPTYANIVTTGGIHVGAWDEGARFEYRFKDGEERTTWVVPLINNDHDHLAVNEISSVEFDVLEALDSYLHDTFFSENLPKTVSEYLDRSADPDETEDQATSRAVTVSATFIVNMLMMRRREIGAGE